nr:DoxX family protein [Aquimarina brevivitae]
MLLILTLFSSLSFIFYGMSCLRSARMIAEFKRFNLPQYRKLVGTLQLIGGFCLLLGYNFYTPLAFIAALGLAILMLLGIFTRIKVQDSFMITIPALFYALLNFYLAYSFFLVLQKN